MTLQAKYSIDFQQVKAGKTDFRLDISDDIFTLWEESEVKKGALTANIIVTKKSSVEYELSTRIEGTVQIECDRCLEEFTAPILYTDTAVIRTADQQDENESENIRINTTTEKIELAQYLYESIILGLPYHRVHPRIEDCDPDMITRFQIIDHDIDELIDHEQDTESEL